MAFAINLTLKLITKQFRLPNILSIIYTDSYLLYKYLIKLRTTKKKRLIIDIIILQQLYKRRELFEIRQINKADNSANAIIKATLNKALETFINTNELRVKIEK